MNSEFLANTSLWFRSLKGHFLCVYDTRKYLINQTSFFPFVYLQQLYKAKVRRAAFSMLKPTTWDYSCDTELKHGVRNIKLIVLHICLETKNVPNRHVVQIEVWELFHFGLRQDCFAVDKVLVAESLSRNLLTIGRWFHFCSLSVLIWSPLPTFHSEMGQSCVAVGHIKFRLIQNKDENSVPCLQ